MQNCQNLTSQQPVLYEEKKVSKKRKSEYSTGNASKKSKTQVMYDVFVESSSSDSDSGGDSEVEEDDTLIQSNSSNDEDEEVQPSPSSHTGFVSDLELSGLDPAELIGGSSNDVKTSCSEFENSGDGDNNDLQEMDDIIR